MIKRNTPKAFTTACISALFSLSLLCTSCGAPRAQYQNNELATINIVDHNGFAETISAPDRLKQYKSVDFNQSLPYKKVVRVYKRNSKGDIKSVLTSYYPNGQIKQSLEAVNGRALGPYKEWHANGHVKLDVEVIGGIAELENGAEGTWLFDGIAKAWNEDGDLLTQIPYKKGELEGVALYFHPNGNIWKKIPYHKNISEGLFETFNEDGSILQMTEFSNGTKHGISTRYWSPEKIASKEEYKDGHLFTGLYFDQNGKQMSEVTNGEGVKIIFGKDYVKELQQYRRGYPEGEMRAFLPSGKVQRIYHVKDGMKHGEEIVYYEKIEGKQPKMSIEWQNDKMNGLVKTWYPNGTLESQKEMHNNAKNGVFSSWYLDGNLMLIEEYQADKLVKGQYYKKGEKRPVSQVIDGAGVATLFDAHGNFYDKFKYQKGEPLKEDNM
jgi:antitoxin component YwqK of YwqJK toxin-antitoxin module